MARTRYNQKDVTLTIDGTTIQDFGESSSITFIHDGGDVAKTEGTDGASINIATEQGATLRFKLRETSRSRKFMSDLRKRQYNGGAGVTVVLRAGADVLETMTEAYVSTPGDLSTGGTKMGEIEYVLMSAEHESSNLSMTGANMIPGGF